VNNTITGSAAALISAGSPRARFEHWPPLPRFPSIIHHPEGTAMGLVILLIVGGLIGWVASMIMRTDGQQGVFLNIIVGIVGALLAGFVVTPLIGGAPITSGVISVQSVLVSLIGAVVLLAIINLFRRGSVR
jgi:uncharacterized membrane protein YeaQ/YmgE (transglycosylase-associated protein family)